MNIKHSIALLALVVPVIATAQEGGKYQCTLGDLVRRVRRRFDGCSQPPEELIVTVPGVGYLLA